MAKFNDIIIKNETRPCWYDGKRAMFHRWVESTKPIMNKDESITILRNTYALIELEDGTVKEVLKCNIKFADGGGFKETAWREEDT